MDLGGTCAAPGDRRINELWTRFCVKPRSSQDREDAILFSKDEERRQNALAHREGFSSRSEVLTRRKPGVGSLVDEREVITGLWLS